MPSQSSSASSAPAKPACPIDDALLDQYGELAADLLQELQSIYPRDFFTINGDTIARWAREFATQHIEAEALAWFPNHCVTRAIDVKLINLAFVMSEIKTRNKLRASGLQRPAERTGRATTPEGAARGIAAMRAVLKRPTSEAVKEL